jgi:hypothetical protein
MQVAVRLLAMFGACVLVTAAALVLAFVLLRRSER